MATVRVVYTDPIGNELTETFTVRSTFFPFGKEYITTNLFSEGTYDEATHTFKTGQYGQMGWVYSNGADMSAYKYLVLKLQKTASGAHLKIFTDNSIWASNHETPRTYASWTSGATVPPSSSTTCTSPTTMTTHHRPSGQSRLTNHERRMVSTTCRDAD